MPSLSVPRSSPDCIINAVWQVDDLPDDDGALGRGVNTRPPQPQGKTGGGLNTARFKGAIDHGTHSWDIIVQGDLIICLLSWTGLTISLPDASSW